MAKLNCILDTATADGKEILLFGDFNCCFMSAHRNNSECKQLKTLFESLNFKQFINSPTRISRDSKSLIDLIAVNYPQNICDSGVVSANLSDHEPVYCVRKINWRKAPAQFKTFRNYANYNPCDFRLIISFVSNGSYCRSRLKNEVCVFGLFFVAVSVD